MQLAIRLFAGLCDVFGASTVTVQTDGSPLTGGGLKARLAEIKPEAAALIHSSFIAKNQAYAGDDEPLSVEDEIALIPPVSGGQGELPEAAGVDVDASLGLHRVTSRPLSIEETCAKVADDEHGAALVFVGTTRRTTFGKRTTLLEYEAYVPMALKTLAQIEDEIGSRWPGSRCAIAHRIGPVPVGETSVVIAVSTPHRADCYEASRYAIERLKQIVPIWKKEVWDDGSEWKGPQSGPWNPLASNDKAPD
ncbi:molybdenum cofactor biosynthesis protein [Paenibacillus flagellatus]|uniref:Molybdopterin synthase catalytic subunit n=1 Tax=Paenibacillus flagellatus TaxID=2211139 RepID=A0A2V5KFF1_9BACL|nr:molybdenum cofactor biosynthesis protein MoaE [Paenibacillus flagellatus]PYI57174.1 molybdopterin converting factor [Paenibacillus flagellatus]